MTLLSDSNDWWTEDHLYKELIKWAKVNPLIDAAASKENTKCDFYFSKEDDALTQEWIIPRAFPFVNYADIWLNPPLGKGMTKKFVLKAIEQYKKYNMNILMLLPAGVIPRAYFQPIWDNFAYHYTVDRPVEIKPIIPRPKFLYKGEKAKWSARNDYIAVLLKKVNLK